MHRETAYRIMYMYFEYIIKSAGNSFNSNFIWLKGFEYYFSALMTTVIAF